MSAIPIGRRGRGQRGHRRRARLLLVAAWLLGRATAAAADESLVEGLELWPSIGWSHGDNRIDLGAVVRGRYESWKSRAPRADGFYGLRSRLRLGYAWRDTLSLLAEVQDARVYSLSPSTSGAGVLYRAFTPGGDESSASSLRVRRLELALEGAETRLVLGRQDIEGGGFVDYADADWRWLRNARLAQRLVGTVGWTNGERSYDGLTATTGLIPGHAVQLFAAQPTTGVFDIDHAYERQKQIGFGGLDWVVKPGTWVRDTELAGFFVAYVDDRNPDDVEGLEGEIEIYTVGGSLLGVYPVGPGRLDVLLWGALQWGDYTALRPSRGRKKLDQLAGGGLVEFGYQLPDVYSRPWLRIGLDIASGDGNPDDGQHSTFFNVLPTGHKYYGYADQLAFQNVADLFAQLRLDLCRFFQLEVMLHRFWLVTDDDGRYFGTGAYSRKTLGYGSTPSQGDHDVGTELDVVTTWPLFRNATLMAGYSVLWGGGVFAGTPNGGNTDWGFVQVELRY